MLETEDLRLDKAKPSDQAAMYQNVWSHPESAQYMSWNVTTNEADAKIRIQKTIAFQKTHDTYLVYLKATGEAIGFAGVEKLDDHTFHEAGICLGPAFVGKGYGKQILLRLMRYCKEDQGADTFICAARDGNTISNRLILSLGFLPWREEQQVDDRNGQSYIMKKYILKL